MLTVTTTFLGLSVSAMVYRSATGRWEIDDITITNDGHDFSQVLKQQALLEIEERVLDAATQQNYRWV